jgi:hypothetical protein
MSCCRFARRRFLILGISACLIVAGGIAASGRTASGQELAKDEQQAGFVPLFNGRDFTHWRFGEESPPKELPANWKVEDGVIHLSGGGKPHLASVDEYGDFELRLEWRGLKPKYNSGLYIRSGKKVGANQLNFAYGKEGSPVGMKLDGVKEAGQLQKPAGEWNEWRVLVQGDKVTFWCNGTLAWEATGLKPAKGYIGIQAEGAPMEFRNIRIREIKS